MYIKYHISAPSASAHRAFARYSRFAVQACPHLCVVADGGGEQGEGVVHGDASLDEVLTQAL